MVRVISPVNARRIEKKIKQENRAARRVGFTGQIWVSASLSGRRRANSEMHFFLGLPRKRIFACVLHGFGVTIRSVCLPPVELRRNNQERPKFSANRWKEPNAMKSPVQNQSTVNELERTTLISPWPFFKKNKELNKRKHEFISRHGDHVEEARQGNANWFFFCLLGNLTPRGAATALPTTAGGRSEQTIRRDYFFVRCCCRSRACCAKASTGNEVRPPAPPWARQRDPLGLRAAAARDTFGEGLLIARPYRAPLTCFDGGSRGRTARPRSTKKEPAIPQYEYRTVNCVFVIADAGNPGAL